MRVWRNLDKEIVFAGIRGKYLKGALFIVLGSVAAALLIGSACGLYIGLASLVTILIVGYLALTEIQRRFGAKGLSRFITSLSMPRYVILNSKPWNIWKRSI